MAKSRIAINGFGRIGRLVFREIFNDKDKFLQIGEDLSRLIKEKEKLYLEWENYL